MNRIDLTFKSLKKENKKAFIAYITAGDPDLKTTARMIKALPEAGVDILEIGIPFSDPLADGPTIQAASQRALKKDVSLEKIFKVVKSARHQTNVPIVFMTYYNPLLHYGEKRFILDAVKSGVDGVIVPDLPPESAENLIKYARRHDISTIFFLAPTTKHHRIQKVIDASTGFIYFVSLTGVTGARSKMATNILSQIKSAKKKTSKPICAGFGISSAQQVKSFGHVADGVIVGSALVDFIHKNAKKTNLISLTQKFIQSLKK